MEKLGKSLNRHETPRAGANLKETRLTHVAVGQRVDVVLDIYPNVTWKGVVESISPATGAEFAILPPQNASGNWVKVVQRLPVRIRLEPHEGEPPLRAGVTATVSIDTGRGRSIADVVAGFLDLFRGKAETAGRLPPPHRFRILHPRQHQPLRRRGLPRLGAVCAEQYGARPGSRAAAIANLHQRAHHVADLVVQEAPCLGDDFNLFAQPRHIQAVQRAER
jgi:hypothetical protein